MYRALLTEASAGVLRSCSLLKQAPSSSQGRACTEHFTREPAYEGLAACSLKLETNAVQCTLQAPMLAGEMEHMDSTPAPSGQWASQGSMPSMQQVRLLSLLPARLLYPTPKGSMRSVVGSAQDSLACS